MNKQWAGHAWRSENPDDPNDVHFGEKERCMDAKRKSYLRIEESQYKRNRTKVSDDEQIIESAWFDDVKAVKRLLRAGVQPDARSRKHLTFHPNTTALMAAAQNGNVEVARLLVSWGAKVEASDDYGHTPLMWAVWHGHDHMVNFLLRKGAHHNRPGNGGWTPLCRAAAYGHTGIVQMLLACGADPQHTTTSGQTAIDYAQKYRKHNEVDGSACVRLLASAVGDKGATGTMMRHAATQPTTTHASAAALVEYYEKSIASGFHNQVHV